MIIKCGYCHRCLSENEYQVLDRKTRLSKKRAAQPKKYNAKDSDIEELRTMKSGEKHTWLKTHRSEILEYLDDHGDAETRRHYGIARLDILPSVENWEESHNTKQMSKIEILQSTIISLHQEIKLLKSQLPQAIATLPTEEQVKLLTFQLSQAVSKLNSKSTSQELNLSDMYKINADGKPALISKSK